MSTMQNYKFIKVGIGRTKAVNLVLNAEGFGKRSAKHITTSNFNLIFAIQNDFDDVYVGTPNTTTNKLEVSKHTISSDNKKLPIGFEYTFREVSKNTYFTYEYGIKYLPGMMKNINLMVTFGVSVCFDILKNK
jgi:hypothetical protein